MRECPGASAERSSNGSRQFGRAWEITWYDEERGQAGCRFEDSLCRLFWHLLTTEHSQWEPVLDDGPSVVQRQLSLLVGVQYIDKLMMCSCDAVAGSMQVALLRNAWLDSGYMFCVSSFLLWPFCSYFYAKGNSDPEVGSFTVLLSGAGEACTVDASASFRAGGHTWKLDNTSTSPLYLAVRCSLLRSCLRSWAEFFGSPR